MSMPKRLKVLPFINHALEASLYVSPDDFGLSFEELVEVGKDYDFREGELREATVRFPRDSTGRLTIEPSAPKMIHDLSADSADPRNLDAIQFIFDEFINLSRDLGEKRTEIDRSALLERIVAPLLLEECLAHVQQPTAVPLPAIVAPHSVSRRISSISRRSIGVIAMITAFGFGLLGMFLWQSTEAPKISGRWTGDEWGQVVLEEKQPGKYAGTYTDTFGDQPGRLQLNWSRVERRFNGTWGEGEDRFGQISVRLIDGEVRGGWTTDKKSKINAATPRLADLLWVRPEKESVKSVREEPASEAMGTVHSADKHDDRDRYSSLPEDLSLPDDRRERLALLIPSNASIQEFADRYEITAIPWRSTITLVDGKLPSRAHDEPDTRNADHNHGHSHDDDDTHDHSHDAQHAHKYTQTEYFADEGKVTLRKGAEGAVTFELVGNAQTGRKWCLEAEQHSEMDHP